MNWSRQQTPCNHKIYGWNIWQRINTCVYKGERPKKANILDVRPHFKPTETFQYTQYSSCHPPGVSKGFIKGVALRLLSANSSNTTLEENIRNFRVRMRRRGYPRHLVDHVFSEVKFIERKSALQNVTQYPSSVPHLKTMFMGNGIG